MRDTATILHLDLDAFFAAVEQRDKPSLRGKPVIVGGLSNRGVVATASYEARAYGVHSAMNITEARRRCPKAAFLAGRFPAYRAASKIVMDLLRELSPLVEPLSLDEAYVDLAAGNNPSDIDSLLVLAAKLRAELTKRTNGLTASVGLGSSKFIAKIATELGKPDGIYLVEPGTEAAVIEKLSVRKIPGVGPATFEKLQVFGVNTVADLRQLSQTELIRECGQAIGTMLSNYAWARDNRKVEANQEAKSISIEDTFDTDLDIAQLAEKLTQDANFIAAKLQKSGLFARTISIKARYSNFLTITRSRTLLGATNQAEIIEREAKILVAGLPRDNKLRLFGVGTSNFTNWAQETLFDVVDSEIKIENQQQQIMPRRRELRYIAGADVQHPEYGRGWVWGTGLGLVTVRFETPKSPRGPIRTFKISDPDLELVDLAKELGLE